MSTFRFRKFHPRHAGIIMPLVLSIMMTFVVSLVATWRSLGLAPDFLPIWMSGWALSWLIAFPTLLVVLPLVRRVVTLLVEAPR